MKDTLKEFEEWWSKEKPRGWLQFPMAQKMAAKSAWDACQEMMERQTVKITNKPCTCGRMHYGPIICAQCGGGIWQES